MIKFSEKEDIPVSTIDEYEKLLDDIRDRLYKAGTPNISAIMSHVDKSLKDWGIHWRVRLKRRSLV